LSEHLPIIAARKTMTRTRQLPTVVFARSKEQETGIKADIIFAVRSGNNFSSKEEQIRCP
jgi:hypothetical protein